MNVPPAVVDEDSELGRRYIAAMQLAGRYSYAGREWVVERVRRIIGGSVTDMVHNHHNYAWRETHNGVDLWVVRKGATPAFPGQRGFVGGSMGDDAVILEGVDSEKSRASLYSTIHGAGRLFGRREAKRRFTRAAMDEWLRDRGVRLSGADLDESPMAYRRLPDVLAHHADTVKVLHTLRPFAVAMAGEGDSTRGRTDGETTAPEARQRQACSTPQAGGGGLACESAQAQGSGAGAGKAKAGVSGVRTGAQAHDVRRVHCLGHGARRPLRAGSRRNRGHGAGAHRTYPCQAALSGAALPRRSRPAICHARLSSTAWRLRLTRPRLTSRILWFDAALRCRRELSSCSDPIIVVEVVSPSSLARDAGAKLEDYFRLPSVQHYLILKTENRTIIHHQRARGWHHPDPNRRAKVR